MGNLPALTLFSKEVAKSQTMEPLSTFQTVRSKVWLTVMSSYLVDKPSEIVDVGDKVWMKHWPRDKK